jgi:hypothetical protein
MDVLWSLIAQPGGIRVTLTHWWDGPACPLLRVPAASLVIGPLFVHAIAQRTLAGLARAAERGPA